MPKRAISVTLDVENLAWLRGRARGARLRSVSELLDRIVTAARAGGLGVAPRSVVGTVAIDDSDPLLERADAAVRALFESSLRRPLAVREAQPEYRASAGRKPKKTRG